jgi:hypothetical protein
VGAGPYRTGDCVEVAKGVAKVGCDRPHEYEVMLSDELQADVPDSYPPPVKTLARPTCRATLPTYLGSPDADASRLETVAFWPTQEQWNIGDRWFACLVIERGPDNRPIRRTGTLAGVLTGGLGVFQRCLAGEPISNDPTRVVPCEQPHRSEAVPGVLVLGSPTEPALSIGVMADRALPHCESVVNAYLGGKRPRVKPSSLTPYPADWPTGANSAVCYAVTETPVTGSLRGS